ncbi:GGDEF domain-containing protein [Cohnella sp.]|uniref:GGDEF domain-containing protein n=1 Tax=Cohnella sp. TaxID=1883426 RepID=UPI0035688458
MISMRVFEVQLLEEIHNHMKEGCIGVLYLDVEGLSELEQASGRLFCEQMLQFIDLSLKAIRVDTPHLFYSTRIGDDFFAYIGLDTVNVTTSERLLFDFAANIRKRIEHELSQRFSNGLNVKLQSGCSLFVDAPDKDLDNLLYSAMKQAIRQVKRSDVPQQQLRNEFNQIIQEQLMYSVYQPIVSLTDAAIFGYEALTRGPENSPFQSPLTLFSFAEEEGQTYSLEKITREKAIRGCSGLKPNQRVFINLSAHIIHDPEFNPGRTHKLLHQCGLSPNNVVFEITERSSIDDFTTVKKVLHHYRAQGYQIAIDDAGAGYSSLQAIAELSPDYIKVDRSLLQNIHENKVKEYILETFVTFARKMNIKIIAEGIETREELIKLMKMGVHFGQGFFLGRPNKGLQPIDWAVTDEINRQREHLDSSFSNFTIGDLALPVKTFPETTLTSQITHYFNSSMDEQGVVIINADKEPVGLVTRDKLFQLLAGQYGLSLYWNKPIRHIMDRQALVVEHRLSPEIVSQMAMSRDFHRLYDFVIIVRDGVMIGVATIRSILESITQVRMENARVSNPLTGLPGNVQIQRNMRSYLSRGLSFSVIYVDIDYFKWFNDRFGFQKGDEVIQYTADIIQYAVNVCGHPHDFVGHIGGDDYIVITSASDSQRLCEEIIRRFQQGIAIFYEDDQMEFVLDRDGNKIAGKGMSLSLALVICKGGPDLTPEHISKQAAKLKKESKAQQGSAIAQTVIE